MSNSINDATLQLRQAVRNDADAIASVLHRSFAEFKEMYTPKAFTATILSPEGVLDRMSEGPTWVGLLDDEIVAAGSAVVTTRGLYVRGMGVVRKARGRGFGWHMLEHMENFAREQGIVRMYLSTTPFLDAAIRLYEKYGFERSPEGPLTLFGTPLYSMVRDVGRTQK